ncbi:hypothetical protein F5Y15DRAFT_423306 [Xylariaceae sp. FL0016]|nr:hypothetical protein F5Y15DRAFT_423306 [Xylariaceae sp. FL0016]
MVSGPPGLVDSMEDIAVVGFSFKLPQGVEDVESFWKTLEGRKNLMTAFPESRMRCDAFSGPELSKRNKLHAQGAHFVSGDPGAFDAPFFSVTAAEAASMDPMQRWTLEASYHAFENSGIPIENLKGSRTAVFSASMTDDYSRMGAKDPENTQRTAITGTFASILPNRVSWYFDLLGPSVHIDTACSGSLVAVDLACQSLRSGDATSALVTGSNLILGPDGFLLLSNLNFLSPDSRCYSFDHRANGYARGEGVVAIVLKPISHAIRDGDMIRAVIRSTGTNQDGHTPGLTQPSPEAQERLIRHVYEKANLSFDQTRYVEAHGTGTPVGDPIEMKAIGRVFRSCRSAQEPLYVGSVKANIGHLEGCSGLAGIIKSIMVLEKGIIPPNALFEKVNPDIDVEFYHTEVPTKSIVWPTDGLRRVSVNSFGFGGTNTHIILDDAHHYLQDHGLTGNHSTTPCAKVRNRIPTDEKQASPNRLNGHKHRQTGNGLNGVDDYHLLDIHKKSDGIGGTTVPEDNIYTVIYNESNNVQVNNHSATGIFFHDGHREDWTTEKQAHNELSLRLSTLLVWSAADEKALERTLQGYTTFYQLHLAQEPQRFEQLAYTLSTKRSSLLWRSFSIVDSGNIGEASTLDISKPTRMSAEVGLAFVFTGQGAQYVDMGLQLLHYPDFAKTLMEVDTIYCSFGCTWSIFDEMRNSSNIDRPEFSQPLSTALQIALVELLKSFGITPRAVVGHSSGEIAAAYSIGALSLLSACKVSYFRGQLAGRLKAKSFSAGAMMSVNLPSDQVDDFLEELNLPNSSVSINVACVNSPLNCTLSGADWAIDAVKERLDRDGVFAQKLKTGVAYHSSFMSIIAGEYLASMGDLTAANARRIVTSIPMVSSVTGQAVRQSTLRTAQYWVDNMVSPVKFSDALQVLVQGSSTLKIGLGSITDIVEVGPHCALRRPINDTVNQVGNKKKQIRYTSVLDRSKPGFRSLMEAVGHIYCHGHAVDIAAVNLQSGDKKPPFLVDCPKYPFDHSHSYWAESRLSRDFRLREPVDGDTLGWRSHDWNPLQPSWRNFWSVETSPWIADHVVSGTVLFPAAGMLIMAMEAAKELAPVNRLVIGYYVKEAHFISPIVVKEVWEKRTETILHLHPIQKPYEKESIWSDIKIFARYDNRWSECFRATVQIQYENNDILGDGISEKLLIDEQNLRHFNRVAISCVQHIDPGTFYEDSTNHGIKWGDSFQLLRDIRYDGKGSVVTSVDLSTCSFHETRSLVHPAILDVAFQALRVATTQGLTASSTTRVPLRLQDGWFAASGWQQPTTGSIRYMTISSSEAGRESKEGSIYALADDGSILCSMKRLITAQVSKEYSSEQVAKELLYGVEWKPQLSLLSRKQLPSACGADEFVKDEETMFQLHEKLKFVLNSALCRTLRQLSDSDREKVPDQLKRQLVWMEYHSQQLNPTQALAGMDDMELNATIEEIETLHPPWKLFTAVVRNLKSIILGDIDPLSVIFDSNLAETFYADMFLSICDSRLNALLDLASHENSQLRILEVGAGTGGMTTHVLSALQGLEQLNGGLRFANYTYTDISPTFFENAANRWVDLKDRVTFKTFNLERDADEQGLELGSYDLVIAGSVLHATTNLSFTLRNVRKTLKPGGRLILLEAVAPDKVMTNFAFGLAPGWWNCEEDWRNFSPAIVEDQWDQCLKSNGFSGNDLCLRDYQDDFCHIFSIIVTTAQAEYCPSKPNSRLYIVRDEKSYSQCELAKSLDAALSGLGHSGAFALSLDQFRHTTLEVSDFVVVLAETDKPFLANISEDGFQVLQDVIKGAQNLIWVTKTNMNDVDYPLYSVVQGFMRSIRTEATEKRLITLAIESQGESCEENAMHVAKVYKTAIDSGSEEVEYVVRDGQVLTGRVVQEISLNDSLTSLLHPQVKKASWLPGPALELTVGTPGILDSLDFVEDRKNTTALGSREVEIEAKAWGLNFRDVYVALGRLDDGALGGDCAGIVTRIGSDCSSGLLPGDRVCMILPGCMRTYPRAVETSVLKIPDNLSFEAAASIVAPGMTAYYSLVDIARLRKGHKILIHSAAGSTGQMAIWVAKVTGAEVFATVGNEDKRQFLVEKFGIPEDHIFYSRDTSFAQGIMRITDGYGVDVVLNSLSGDGLRASWECVAPYGRFVEIGKADIMANSSLPMACFAKNVSFSAFDLVHLSQSDEELTAKLLKDTVNLLGKGAQHPMPLHVYPVSKAEQAFRYLQSGKNIGRIVIGIDREDVVPKRVLERKSWRFDKNATYVVAGGLGGLGRAIMQWMADRGAKHILALSRSGPVSSKAANTIRELKDNGVDVFAPKCDVSSSSALATVLEDCATRLPPIKGCINAAMVLQDAVFENMTHAQWALTIGSKVQSSWNLHHLLPKDLNFFVLLSSLAGICGTVAQSNYAGGCSSQDALARYRTHHGLKAISFDVGWMRNIGIIAEKKSYQRNRKQAADMQQIDDTELLALLSIYCDPDIPLLSVPKSQVLIGLLTPADFLVQGQTPPQMHDRPLFSSFSHIVGNAEPGSSTQATEDPAVLFKKTKETDERIQIVIRALSVKLARAMSISPDDVEPSKPLSSYGVDSLMAVELRNYIGREFQASVAVFDIMGGVPIAAIGDLVVERSNVGQNREGLTN